MKILFLAAIFALLYTVSCKPSKPSKKDQLEDIYGPLGDEGMQNDNDNEYDDDYDDEKGDDDTLDGDTDETISITTVGQEFVKSIGETVQLPCNISGSKTAVQIWQKGGHILFQDVSRIVAAPNINLLPGGVLEIANIRQEDAGDYNCRVMVSKQTNPEITHHLKVRIPPHDVHINANNKTVLKEGDSLMLTCKASGFPKPKISWHRGSERLGTEGEKLVIPNVKHHNAGWYRCLADNGIGEPSHDNVEIHVESKPMVMLEKISVSSETNQDTELKCTVHGYPKPQVNWKKNEINLQNNAHTQIRTENHHHILLINGLQESDFGTYTCYAANSLGHAQKHIKIVKTPVVLRFIKPENDTKDVVLTWEVESKSPVSEHELEYRREGESKWRKVKPEVNNSENEIYRVQYTLNSLEPGRYETRLRSYNNNGWSEYSDVHRFAGVFAKKHGHHNKTKNGRKDNKDKHNPPETTPQNIPIIDEIPAEHSEGEKQSGLVKDTPSVGASSGSSSVTCGAALISIALIVLLQIRQ